MENKVDINSLIGFFLIGIIFIGWLYLNPPPEVTEDPPTNNLTAEADNGGDFSDSKDEVKISRNESGKANNDIIVKDNLKNKRNSITKEKIIEVVTDKYKLQFSSKGGQIVSVELKDHLNYLQQPVKLIDPNNANFNLSFKNQNNLINTNDKNFEIDKFKIGSEIIVIAKWEPIPESFIEYKYTISPKDYLINFDLSSQGFNDIINQNETYDLQWEVSANRNSKSISYENRYTYMTYYYNDDNIDYLSISGDDDDLEENVNWVSFKQHFFSSVLIPEKPLKVVSLKTEDKVDDSIESPYTKKFTAEIPFEYENQEFNNSFKFYFGPNDYSQLKSYNIGLEESIDFGWGIFGFINKNIFVPLYKFLSDYLPYGIAIIFMTFIVRIVLAPILYKSYLSQAKMKILKPELNEINKKFKDNAMKRQQEMMSLYRKAGANPMSGCLPGLLQLPVFYALFMFFPSAFDLRQKSFLWAEDLSAYDSVLDFGFYIPLYGDHISLFPILASISIFFYMKMTTGQQMSSQPQQEGMPDMAKMMKYMIYFAPIMMMVFFNNYSSGLSLYYFVSNLLSIAIMYTIKNYILDEKKIREQIQLNKLKPEKPPSRFQRKMQAIMDEAERQKKNRK
tara:strand:+ start:242 stop:2101 length:1860 start_codon:yes stop_codon:yes gene_type:complete